MACPSGAGECHGVKSECAGTRAQPRHQDRSLSPGLHQTKPAEPLSQLLKHKNLSQGPGQGEGHSDSPQAGPAGPRNRTQELC